MMTFKIWYCYVTIAYFVSVAHNYYDVIKPFF